MATTLKTWLVPLTDGLVYPRTLTWKGKSRNAPETPPIDVKKETTKATNGGKKTHVFTPETGNVMYSKSRTPLMGLFPVALEQ